MKKVEYSMPELTPEQEEEIAWTKEEVEKIPLPKWVYRVICFLLRKDKLTYQDLFMLIYGMNKRHGEKKAKEYALQRVIWIFELNNGMLPKGIEKDGT